MTIARRIALYAASRGITEGLLGVRGVVLASVLGPSAFGAWSLLRLASRYIALPALGMHRGLERTLVQAPGDRERLIRSALGLTVTVFGLAAAAAFALSFAAASSQTRLLLRGFAALVVAEQMWLLGLVVLRARGAMREYARLEMVQALIQLILAIGLAVRWGLAGAVAGLVVGFLVMLAMVPRRLVPLLPSLRFRPLNSLLRIGVPLAVTAAAATTLATADRWLVAISGGTALLGVYSLAASIGGLAVSFAWVIRTVVFPDVYRRAGAIGTAPTLRLHLLQTVRPFALLYPIILGAMSFAIEPALALLLPRYVAAGAPAQVFILSGVASGVASLAAVGAIASDEQRSLPAFSGFALIVNLVWSAAALRLGAGLGLVAVGALAGQTIYAASIVRMNAAAAQMPRPTRFMTRLLMPVAWCAAALLVVGAVVPGDGAGPAAVKLAVYTLAVLPLLPAAVREGARALAR